jgi:glycosyltransferase involved in cell wall biosynthesis
MTALFDTDEQPGKPKILFIGLGHSSHTHSWIDLFENSQFNVRLFCTSPDLPPAGWKVRTYVTAENPPALDPLTRQGLFSTGKAHRFVQRTASRARGRQWNVDWLVNDWLLDIVRDWQPHIVHTLGLDAAHFYLRVRHKLAAQEAPKWVLQTRGGSDLQLTHLNPDLRPELAAVLRSCDQLLSDNNVNYRIAREMGVREDQLSIIGTAPGTGGIDVDALAAHSSGPSSGRRLILWPKAVECPWSKALPVFEALKLCWEHIQPCEIEMLAMCPEARMYFWTLPENIRAACRTRDRIPRAETLRLMTRARVMLAPSLVDGTPNSLFEAMAAGALPVVSPLETIRSIVREQENVVFARNLYPEEIAGALVRAMTEDLLVDEAATRNLELVRRIANRDEVRIRVMRLYEFLAGGASSSGARA